MAEYTTPISADDSVCLLTELCATLDECRNEAFKTIRDLEKSDEGIRNEKKHARIVDDMETTITLAAKMLMEMEEKPITSTATAVSTTIGPIDIAGDTDSDEENKSEASDATEKAPSIGTMGYAAFQAPSERVSQSCYINADSVTSSIEASELAEPISSDVMELASILTEMSRSGPSASNYTAPSIQSPAAVAPLTIKKIDCATFPALTKMPSQTDPAAATSATSPAQQSQFQGRSTSPTSRAVQDLLFDPTSTQDGTLTLVEEVTANLVMSLPEKRGADFLQKLVDWAKAFQGTNFLVLLDSDRRASVLVRKLTAAEKTRLACILGMFGIGRHPEGEKILRDFGMTSLTAHLFTSFVE